MDTPNRRPALAWPTPSARAETMPDHFWIKERLHALRLREADLARALGVHASQITRLIRGARKLAAGDVAILARVLEMTAAEILERLGEDAPALSAALAISGYIVGDGRVVERLGSADPQAERLRLIRAIRRPADFIGEAFIVASTELGRYELGDVLCCAAVAAPELAIDQEAVVTLPRGERLFRRILAGTKPGRFALVPRSGRELRHDAAIAEALVVVNITLARAILPSRLPD